MDEKAGVTTSLIMTLLQATAMLQGNLSKTFFHGPHQFSISYRGPWINVTERQCSEMGLIRVTERTLENDATNGRNNTILYIQLNTDAQLRKTRLKISFTAEPITETDGIYVHINIILSFLKCNFCLTIYENSRLAYKNIKIIFFKLLNI